MDTKETIKQEFGATMARKISSIQERDANILILHYRQNMSPRSLSYIFSICEEDVKRIISTFAEQFSNTDNLYNVIDGLTRMKKEAKTMDTSADVDKALAAKDAEIADLKRRLTQSEIKAEAYEEMVRVAEEAFKIPIRKKFGAK